MSNEGRNVERESLFTDEGVSTTILSGEVLEAADRKRTGDGAVIDESVCI